jgi:cytochrome c nitrite reductase small subunit
VVRVSLEVKAALAVSLLIGIVAGVGGFTFVYAKGGSYLTNDPKACLNCHVMKDQYDGWTHASHHAVATCNDCHTPHNLVGKYWTKALNGWHHSVAFTTGNFHEPIQIGPRNKAIAEASCRHCHETIVDGIDTGHPTEPEMSCIRCHSNVGHLH